MTTSSIIIRIILAMQNIGRNEVTEKIKVR